MERRDSGYKEDASLIPAINENWLSAFAPSQVYSEPSKRRMRAGRDRVTKATPLNWLFDRGRAARIVVSSRQIGHEDVTLRLPGLLSA